MPDRPIHARFFLASAAAVLLLDLALAAIGAGARGGAALTWGCCAVYASYAIASGDRLLWRLGVLGLAAGVAELLWADPIYMRTGNLAYAPTGPFLLDSPLYMPLAWAAVLLHLGYLGAELNARWGVGRTSLAVGLAAGALIPLFEEIACRAGYWSYAGSPAIGHVPTFVIASEFLIGLTLPLGVEAARRLAIPWSAAIGAALGAWMRFVGEVTYRALG